MSALALSVLLSFVSAVAYAGGAIVQEQVAVSSPDEQYAPLRRPSWWGAMALNGLGGLLHVVALAYGPLSLVQPLGALTIVFALPMAALFVGREAGATAWRGAIMATVGLAGLLSLVGSSDSHALDSAGRIGVALVTGGAVVALMIAGRAAHRHPAVRSVLLATASGIAFGMSSVFTKVVAIDWDGGIAPADAVWLAVIGAYAVAGVMISQASYRGGGLAAPLATLTVVNPVLAAAVGISMFGEAFRYGATGTLLALGCGVLAAGGLILLTTERIESTPHPAPTPPLPASAPTTPPEPLVEALTELAEKGLADVGPAGAGLAVAGRTETGSADGVEAEAGPAVVGPAGTGLAVVDGAATGQADDGLTGACLAVAGRTETGSADGVGAEAGLVVVVPEGTGPVEAGLSGTGPAEGGAAGARTVDAGLVPEEGGAGAGRPVSGGLVGGEAGSPAVTMPQQRTASAADVADVLLPAADYVHGALLDRRRTRVPSVKS
ncbi:DMT family transporter [Streptomyces sp. NPDC021562]|uniref:DMT family transporter n=1 Tax=Streptomyces sp. NPDC021562 TaxID=3155121 RepID=UPI0033CA7FA4